MLDNKIKHVIAIFGFDKKISQNIESFLKNI